MKRQTLQKKNQIEILDLENTTTKMKNSLKMLNGRYEMAGERIREHKDRSIEFIQSE